MSNDEQMFLKGLEEDQSKQNISEGEEGDLEKQPQKQTHKEVLLEDDGLSFDCEICADREGGCSSCGFGRNRK